MEIFRLVSSMKIEDDGTVNVCLKPDNNLINEYIATYRTYESLSVAEYSLNSFIIEMIFFCTSGIIIYTNNLL